ncbi:SPFH domain-containing protein [Mycobacteroides abscessus]|uniref:SPFH domain-containing protein n=1 Tax=Mycobacteroides abscessus TaxID=36809 RepID=UPI00092961B4|nr:SPFH domain-containing protein [Mycobacteroides abscessus]SHZ23445.1 putative alanine and valine rich protein [Mycobacteroides abscessus subsp. abscessus]SHZ91020.1 putative alanine and valine rich protein [Mycobacteroides abscessus subsp. abscessus]SHZ91606.1 putative alanine and valine rich protein [Mycobacteroides abscessus subsp. abscessus]SIA62851.1 putative alanine and valine rich protein [Mycobacteroides abscessus subsp. abscessus]SIC37340.1 putative alanine and valine rich protein [
MSWEFVTFLIFGSIAVLLLLGGLVGRRFNRRADGPVVTLFMGGIALAIAVLVLVIGSFTVVGTRKVGIETVFGKPSGDTLSNGLHWKKPWATVDEMDAAVQIDKYEGNGRIKVRLGNSSTADADVSVRWQIKQDAADELYVQYRSFDNVRTNLITRNLQVSLNDVFSKLDPLATKWANGLPLETFAKDASEKLRALVGDQVDILDVAVPTIDYDDGTEARINELNAERANTAKAEQAKKTATEQAEANRILSSSVSNDPNVIVQNCITKALDKSMSPWGCWPGTGALATIPAPIK